MELTSYAITEDNRLVYAPKSYRHNGFDEYTVWGIGEYGFLHGAGYFLKKEDVERFEIDVVPYKEIDNYYDLLNKFNK